MKPRALLISLLGLAIVVPGLVSAQPGYMRKGYNKKEGDAAPKKSARKRRSRKKSAAREAEAEHGMPMKSGTDKASIEVYLQSRLKVLKKTNRAQGVYGRRMKLGWDKFWTKMYEDRKQFEIRLAKQRLNLFESLSSLDPSFHERTIADFERLQDTQVKSFEANLEAEMANYLTSLSTDLKAYAVEQEQSRSQFMVHSIEAWQNQKAETLSRK